LNKKLDGELTKATTKEGVHRSVVEERVLTEELQVSNLERTVENLLSAERLRSSARVKSL